MKFSHVHFVNLWRTSGADEPKTNETNKQNDEGKRPNEFAEWHVAWLAEWHNYAEFKMRSWMIQRNKLNWKERPFLAPINLQTQPLF